MHSTRYNSLNNTAGKPKKSGIKKFFAKNAEGWMFVFPLFVGLAIFTVYPMIQSFIWSFYKYQGLVTFEFVEFRNFIHIFTKNKIFPIVLRNTFFYAFGSVPIVLVASYLVATLVNSKVKGVGIFRVLYYLPCVIPGVVSGLLWKDIFSQNGIFNQILAVFGAHSDFFESDNFLVTIPSIFLMNMWSIGGGMILWLSAFKAIPVQLYESAEIDGAGRVNCFFHITIPMSMPMIFFNVVTMLIGTMQYNGTMTFAPGGYGGKENALYMYGVFIYYKAFQESSFGYASALSWILLVIICIMTGILFLLRRYTYMGEDS